MSEICFHLSDSNLKSSENCTDLILESLNSKAEQVKYLKFIIH